MTFKTAEGYVLPLKGTHVELSCEYIDPDRGPCPERATAERVIHGKVWLMCADHPGSGGDQ